MKRAKRFIALALSLVICFSCVCVSASAETEQGTDYPYIFVHGMGGWAPDNPFYAVSAYWGGGLGTSPGTDLIEILKDSGKEVYAPAVGPLSSAWDRACELYAQLMGTVVDYGEAHSKAHNHDRFGFSYEGKPIMGEPWNMEDKLNLVGHSFGGETVRLFTSLLVYGSEEELAATGEDISPLFVGGHDGVHSCVTLSSPHNGSQVANAIFDSPISMPLIAIAFNLIGATFGNNFFVFSLQLSHFGLTPAQGEKRASVSWKAIRDFFEADDNCGHDLTIRGARELNETIKLAPNTYYYSYTTVASKESVFGNQVPVATLNPIFYISSAILTSYAGKTVDGIKIEGDWLVNDGIVPYASGLYPITDAATAKDYEEALALGEEIEPGRWYYLDTMYGMDHFDFCGTKDYPMGFPKFYFDMIDTVNSR